ncbi:MAG: hypothetical protein QG622_2354 [Actinomycetota bacterium]|nr:hypothetical protein [Actinomycetota bacterium]
MLQARRRAVVIGVNGCRSPEALPALKYAENDAASIRDILTNDAIGTFRPEDVKLVTGPRATSGAVKRELRRAALETRQDDILIIYFSGHGFVQPRGHARNVYLVTSDLHTDTLVEDPDLGVRMTFLRHDVLDEVEGSSLLIFDCCFPEDRAAGPELFGAVSSLRPGSHAALLSCVPGHRAKERDDVRHGRFTQLLLEGLAGKASSFNGEVTLESLFMTLKDYPEISPTTEARNWQTYVALTRPGTERNVAGETGRDPLRPVHIGTVRHPLDPQAQNLLDLLSQLVSALPSDASRDGAVLEEYKLEALRTALGARGAGIVTVSLTSGRELVAATDPNLLDGLAESVEMLSKASMGKNDAHRLEHLDGEVMYWVPLYTDRECLNQSVLVLVGLPNDRDELGQPLAIFARTFMRPKHEASGSSGLMELGILSELRSSLGRLPTEFEERALRLYRQAIEGLSVIYQPVRRLSQPGRLGGVCGYEALAREDPSHHSAPTWLLNLAFVWDDEFVIQRDLTIGVRAIDTYVRYHESLNRSDDPQPLSINVSPAALFSPRYVAAVGGELRAKGMEGAVTLEISEGEALGLSDEDCRKYLSEFMKEYEVSFSIDDFGVGHASLDRLARLDLAQIKIDRAILEHKSALQELEFIVQLAKQGLTHGDGPARKVILEGLDPEIQREHPELTLPAIYDVGIRYVQGFVNGEPLREPFAP